MTGQPSSHPVPPSPEATVGHDPGRTRPVIPRASSWVRAVWWDQLLRVLCGGVGVAGPIPSGPAVVVANHSSHADTAALVAVLGKHASVLVVAGGDYWNGWRGRLARDVVGILPIARDGGFEALVEAAGAHLRAGGIVVMYPEGTRTKDGTLGRFRSGAARLGAATGAPLVPAAIFGTRELFGKGHAPRLASTRTHPLGVRLGPPVLVAPPGDRDDPGGAAMSGITGVSGATGRAGATGGCDGPVDTTGAATAAEVGEQVRAGVGAMLALGAPAVAPSVTWEWARVNLRGRNGMMWTFGWAFAEGLFWPVVAEAGVVPVALAHGRRAVPAVAASAAGSVAGVAANWALARAGVRVPWPLTTSAMHDRAREQLRVDVAGALRQQRGNGIPVKVYARCAGQLGVPAVPLVRAAALARGSRIVPVGLVAVVAGEVAGRRVRVGYGGLLTVAAVGVASGLELVVRSWKRDR